MKRKIYSILKKIFGGRGFNKYSLYKKTRTFFFWLVKDKVVDVNGYKLYSDIEHGIDFSGKLQGHGFEISTTEFFKREVNPGDTVLDIGADVGYYTCLFAKLVGPSGKVFAFEPNPKTSRLLRKNIAVNGFKNVTVFEKAVADKEYKDVFYPVGPHSSFGYDRFHGSEGGGVQVDCVRVDSVIKDNVNFIKMDIEGSEWKAIKGMKNVFENSKKVKLLTEFCPELLKMSGGNLSSFLIDLKSLGFKLYDVNRENGQERDADYFISTYDKPAVDGVISVTNILCVR